MLRFVALWVLVSLLLSLDVVRRWLALHWNVVRRTGQILCLLIVVLSIAGGLFAAYKEQIIYHDEATVLSIAAAFLHGQPIYPRASYPAEYGLLYGPATYFVYLPPLIAGADRIGAFQAWAMAALAGTFLLLYRSVRNSGRTASLGALAYLAIFVCFRSENLWAIKGDVWILFFAALGLCASLEWGATAAAIGIAFSGAMLIDLKMTTALVAILPLILLWNRGSRYRAASIGSFVLMALLAGLPFLSPRISSTAYLQQLREASGHGFSRDLLKVNLLMAAEMCLPMAAMLWLAFRTNRQPVLEYIARRRVYLALAGISLCIALVTGSKNGAGPWHLFAVGVPLAFLSAECWGLARSGIAGEGFVRARSAPLIALVTALFLLGINAFLLGVKERERGLAGFIPAPPRAVESDILAVTREHPGASFQMGYSDNAHYGITFVRPVLQEHGSPLFIDPDARNEADLLGLPVSQPILDRLRDCSIEFWLIPRGGQPFSMESLYAQDKSFQGKLKFRELYPNDFREEFLATYERIPTDSQYFDLWGCRSRPVKQTAHL